ncbi:MAG TPA: hypothetical protein VFA03_08935 [Acetobacteraceae bacterium]|nr:hypothetical protein [Acetobacteraceae bacterium]
MRTYPALVALALCLAAAPALAQQSGGSAPAAGNAPKAMEHAKPMHHSASMHHASAKRGMTSGDAAVEQLNAMSLAAAQKGQAFNPPPPSTPSKGKM